MVWFKKKKPEPGLLLQTGQSINFFDRNGTPIAFVVAAIYYEAGDRVWRIELVDNESFTRRYGYA